MMKEEFFNKTQTALDEACKLLDAPKSALTIVNTRETPEAEGEEKKTPLLFEIHLAEGVRPNLPLRILQEAASRRLHKEADFLTSQSGRFYLKRFHFFCSELQWGEDLYRDMQNQLMLRYETSIGLSLTNLERLLRRDYEGDRCNGGLVFISEPEECISEYIDLRVTLAQEVRFEEQHLRHVRKLLAGAGDDLLLFQRSKNGPYVFRGYAKRELVKKPVWSADLIRGAEWRLQYRGEPLFRFVDGAPKMMRDVIGDTMERLRLEFGPCLSGDEDLLRRMLQEASCQKHGTALVFVDFSDPVQENRVEQLYKLGRGAMSQLNSAAPGTDGIGEQIKRVSRMDGAMIVSAQTLDIRFISMIVDGRAIVPGRSDRGARHNSIRTFLSDLVCSEGDHRIAAAIFSEDGGIEIVCGSEFRASDAQQAEEPHTMD